MIQYLRSEGIYIQWYDSIATQADGTVDGVVRYRNMLDYRNRDWLMDDTQGRVADSMWLNYWWNWKMIDESVELAESLGLDPFESLFLGVGAATAGSRAAPCTAALPIPTLASASRRQLSNI